MRNPFFDNAKVILILLVVFGHLIIWKGSVGADVKWMIYSFHMPAFIFIAGYFSKKETWNVVIKTSINRFIIPYLLFQSSYNFINYFWFDRPLLMNYDLANFSLWFLLSMVFWKISMQFVIRWKWILAAFVLLFFTHRFFLDDPRTFALGRSITFSLFFFAGYYAKLFVPRVLVFVKGISIPPFLIKGMGLAGLSLTFWLYNIDVITIPRQWFYGYFFPMEELLANHSIPHLVFYQLYVFCFSLILTVFFLMAVPTKRYAWTDIGKATMSIYLLHGLFRNWFLKEEVLFSFHNYGHVFATLAISIGIVYLLSRKPFNDFIEMMSTIAQPTKK